MRKGGQTIDSPIQLTECGSLGRFAGLVGVLTLVCAGLAFAQEAPLDDPFAPGGADDPFAESQLEEISVAGSAALGGPLFTVRGFVDTGYIQFSQSGPAADGGELSWAYGNSQFTFFSETSSFTVNEVDLTLAAETESGGRLMGARASIDYYPSRDLEAYQTTTTDRPFDVDEAFVFVEFLSAWNTRIALGRHPGFVTLEQQEADSPDLRLIGHTYVFLAGGGYPYGLQVHTRPGPALTVKLGVSNGGLGSYSFFPGDDSILNRPVAADADERAADDRVDGRTTAALVQYIPFDVPSGAGTLTLGAAYANNPELTFDEDSGEGEPYTFTNVYLDYRFSDFDLRGEYATIDVFYQDSSVGSFKASMAYLLLGYFLGANHLFTARWEQIAYETDLDPGNEGEAIKLGLTYRYRMDDHMVLKLESVTETQSPQFFNPTLGEDLTTNVLAASWIYSY